jgi:aspartyl-tRNA(Asn)/glutamyl-tRNA(Gln) amidotransferase subunit A
MTDLPATDLRGTPELPLTVTDAAAALRAGTVTSLQLTEAAITRADRHDEELGVYLVRFDDYARQRAVDADAELASGVDRGPLHGIPFGVKDIIAMAEGPTTAQSLVLDRGWAAGKDAPVVSRIKAAGAVITGKATTMEFAIGMVDPAKPFPVPRNPWDPATWPGGSSSGTGAGVAGGLFLAGFGSDTGGSIRIPAAYCGVSGLMPTFGRVPKSGVAPLGYSLDHVGPLARSARDCAEVLSIIAGYDPSDPDCVDRPLDLEAALTAESLAGKRIGVVRENHFPDNADPALSPAFDCAVATLVALGADVVEISLPYWEEMITADLVTMCSEAAAYHRPDLQSRWNDFFASTRATLALGGMVSGADYVQAQRMRRVAQTALAGMFGELDAMVMPTVATGSPTYESLGDEAGRLDVRALFGTIFTPYWDSVGNPALVVPMGFTAAGLPLSMQIAGPAFGEAAILGIGAAYQRRTDWHLQTPALIRDVAVAA